MRRIRRRPANTTQADAAQQGALLPPFFKEATLRPELRRLAGYTLIELISVLVVIGVMAAYAVPRLADPGGFQSRGFYDRAQGFIAYAQKLAIAQRRSPPTAPIYVVVGTTSIKLCNDAGCASPVLDASNGGAQVLNAPTGVTLSPAVTFSFDGSGAASATTVIRVNSTAIGDSALNRLITVEAATGYVHQ